MTKAQAQRRVSKLEALAADRAAQPGEKATAARKASELRVRYGLDREPRPRTRLRPRPTPRPTPGPVQFRVVYIDPSLVNIFEHFDLQTGQSDGEVKVHYHRDRHNWKVELPID